MAVAPTEVPPFLGEDLTEIPSFLGDDLTEIIGEYSIPHMSDMNSDSLLTQSQYAKVIFHDIADAYPTDADVCCRYSLTSGVTAGPGDHVALYRVGWSSVQEFLLSEPVPEPETSRNEPKEFQVLFKARSLPKDVREFYQLCYVTADGNVCGASVPFQFRRPQEEDLCVVEGPEGMAVVRTRTALVEERMRKAERERRVAERRVLDLEEGYGSLSRELQAALQRSSKLETEKQALDARLDGLEHVERLLASLKRDYQALDDEKNESCSKLQQAEQQAEVLAENIRALNLEKEQLSSLLRTEARQKVDGSQYRSQAESLQAMLEALTQSKEMVAQELRTEQLTTSKLRADMEHSQMEIAQLRDQVTALTMEKQSLQYLLDQSLSAKHSLGSSGEADELRREVEDLRRDKERLLAQLTHAAGAEQERAQLRSLLDRNKENCSLQEQLVMASRENAALRVQIQERDEALHDAHCGRVVLEQELLKKDQSVEETRQFYEGKVNKVMGELNAVKRVLQAEWCKSEGVFDPTVSELRNVLLKKMNDAAMQQTGEVYNIAEPLHCTLTREAMTRERSDSEVKLSNAREDRSKGMEHTDLEKALIQNKIKLAREMENLRMTLTQSHKTLAQSNMTLDEVRMEERIVFTRRINELQRQVVEANRSRDDMQSRREAVGKDCLEKKLVTLEREVVEAKKTRDVERSLRESLVESILQEERLIFGKRVNELERKLDEANKKLEEEVSVRQGLVASTLDEERHILSTRINELERELADVRNMLERERSGREHAISPTLIEERTIFAKRINDLEKELAEVKKALEKETSIAARAGEDRKIFGKRINELERELLEANKKLSEEKLQKNIEGKVWEELGSLEAEKVSLEGELREANGAIAEFADRIVSVEARLLEVTNECGSTERELQQVLETLGKRREELETLQEFMQAQERRLRGELGFRAAEDYSFASADMRGTKEEVQHKMAFVESSVMWTRELQDRIEELVQERNVLEQQLSQAKEGKAERERGRCELISRLGQIEGKVSRMLKEQGEAANDKTQLGSKAMLEDLKRRLQLASVEYSKLYQDKLRSERRLAKLLHRKNSTTGSPVPATPPAEPATVHDLLTLSQDTHHNSSGDKDVICGASREEVPTTSGVVGGPNFCFVCPFCTVTFPPGAYDLFTQHFDNHLS